MPLILGIIILIAQKALGSPLENSFDGYDYLQPPCSLVFPSTITSTVPFTITESVTKTQTIVTIFKPKTITSTAIVPSTTTEFCTVTSFRTDFRTLISTFEKEQPPVTKTDTVIETRWKTTSYPITTTDVTTITSFLTNTATKFITEKSTATRILTSTIPVTTTLTTNVCTLDNAYLPVKNNPTCVLSPPSTYLPVDILPPFAPSTLEAIVASTSCPDPSTITITERLKDPAPPITGAIVVQPSASTSTTFVQRDVVTVTKSLTRARSVILYDQLVTKLVSVTPTLTSYIYLDPVTKTVPGRRTPPK